jgi:phosphoribosylglycinamide formyltransferase-1
VKTAVIISTGGAVVRHVAARHGPFRQSLAVFVSDRQCPGILLGQELGIPCRVVAQTGSKTISDAMLEVLAEFGVDYAYVFYTRLLRGPLLSKYEHRLVNFHPSLLPACPGMHGFDDSIRSGARVIGSTVHFIDDGCDTGPQIMQTILPLVPGDDPSAIRHRIFLQQCRALAQVHDWLAQGRIAIEAGAVRVAGAAFAIGEFLPNLDSPPFDIDPGAAES